jgi:HNH endonuclease
VAGVKGSQSGKEGVVDHKNRKRGDNRKSNLRVVTKQKNAENR